MPNLEHIQTEKPTNNIGDLNEREQRDLSEFLKNPDKNVADIIRNLREHPEFKQVLEKIWSVRMDNITSRIATIEKITNSENNNALRKIVDTTGTELEKLFVAAKTLRAEGIDVSIIEEHLRSMAQNFVSISTAENIGDHLIEEKSHETKKTKTPYYHGLESSLRLVGPILENSTGDQAIQWLKNTHLRISKDGWQNATDAKVYRELIGTMHRNILNKLATSGDATNLTNFAHIVSGRNGSMDSNLCDPAIAREALLVAMTIGEKDTKGQTKPSVMERYVPEIQDPVVQSMNGCGGVVNYFRTTYGRGAEEIMKQLGCSGTLHLTTQRYGELSKEEQAKISLLARFAQETQKTFKTVFGSLERQAAWGVPDGKLFKNAQALRDYKNSSQENRNAIAQAQTLVAAVDKTQEFSREVGRLTADNLSKALETRTSTFGNLESGLTISPQERKAMQLFLNIEGVGALNFSDETLKTMGEVAKITIIITASIATAIATGGLATGPIAAAILGGVSGAVAGGTVATAIEVTSGHSIVKEDFITEQALNLVLSAAGGAATAKALQLAMAAKMATAAGRTAATEAESVAAKATVEKAISEAGGNVSKAASKIAAEFHINPAELEKALSVTRLATNATMDVANFGVGSGAEYVRQTAVLGNEANFLEIAKNGLLLATVSHAAGNAKEWTSAMKNTSTPTIKTPPAPVDHSLINNHQQEGNSSLFIEDTPHVEWEFINDTKVDVNNTPTVASSTENIYPFKIDLENTPIANPKNPTKESINTPVLTPKPLETKIQGGETIDRTNIEYFFKGTKQLSEYACGEKLTISSAEASVVLVVRDKGHYCYPEQPNKSIDLIIEDDNIAMFDVDTQTVIQSFKNPKISQNFDTNQESLSFGKFDDSGVDAAVAEGKLTDTQLADLTSYMESGFADTNKRLRTGTIDPHKNTFSITVNKVLDQLPEVRGTVYRGIGTSTKRIHEYYAQQYRKGAIVDENAFTSCSEQRSVAKEFAQQSQKSGIVIFEIESTGGAHSVKNIRIANFKEQEALFKAGIRFEVTDQAQIGENSLYIKMREIGVTSAQTENAHKKIAR